jgi:hypothetical protein
LRWSGEPLKLSAAFLNLLGEPLRWSEVSLRLSEEFLHLLGEWLRFSSKAWLSSALLYENQNPQPKLLTRCPRCDRLRFQRYSIALALRVDPKI